MSFVDYYSTLLIPEDASLEQIKAAFRELAKKYHPDKNSAPNASELFKNIFEAYEVLKDEQKRKAFDNVRKKHYDSTRVVLYKVYENDSSNFKEDREKAHQQADFYSNMPYNDFINSALFEIRFIAKNSPKIYVLTAMILFGAFMIILGFVFVIQIAGKQDSGAAAIVFLFFLGFGGLFIYWAIKDFEKLSEKRKNIKNSGC